MIITTGGDDEYQSRLYGEASRGMTDRVSGYIDKLVGMANTSVGYGRGVLDDLIGFARDRFDRTNSEVARLRRRASRSLDSGRWGSDSIRFIERYEELINPPRTMMPYLMANPIVRHKHRHGILNGYSGDYIDVDPGVYGEDHADYRAVMSGIVQTTDDGWHVKQWFDDEMEELDIVQKTSILEAWGIQGELIDKGVDPTSQYGSIIGSAKYE